MAWHGKEQKQVLHGVRVLAKKEKRTVPFHSAGKQPLAGRDVTTITTDDVVLPRDVNAAARPIAVAATRAVH